MPKNDPSVASTFSDKFRNVDQANPGRQIDSGTNLQTLINVAADHAGSGNVNAPVPAMTGPQVANGLAGE